jgi:hypothetical protein
MLRTGPAFSTPHSPRERDRHDLGRPCLLERMRGCVEGGSGRVDVVDQDDAGGRSPSSPGSHRSARVEKPGTPLEADLWWRGPNSLEPVSRRQAGLAGERRRNRRGLVETVPAPAASVCGNRNQRAAQEAGRRARCQLRRHEPADRERSVGLEPGHNPGRDSFVGERRPRAIEAEPAQPALPAARRFQWHGSSATQAPRLGQRHQSRTAVRAESRTRWLRLPADGAKRRHDQRQDLVSKHRGQADNRRPDPVNAQRPLATKSARWPALAARLPIRGRSSRRS